MRVRALSPRISIPLFFDSNLSASPTTLSPPQKSNNTLSLSLSLSLCFLTNQISQLFFSLDSNFLSPLPRTFFLSLCLFLSPHGRRLLPWNGLVPGSNPSPNLVKVTKYHTSQKRLRRCKLLKSPTKKTLATKLSNC